MDTDGTDKLMRLGKLGIEAELSSCSLCRLFHAARIQDDDNPSVDTYNLYLTHSPSQRATDHTVWGRLVFAIAKGSRSIHLEYEKAFPAFIAHSEGLDTVPHAHSLRGRAIDTRAINFNILRRWIELCDQQHEGRCTQVEQSASSLEDMKLIDCELRRIVPALPSYRFSALSYVWGTSRSGDEDQCIHNILPTTLPRTIEDAMSVTKKLGLRYIWIDRYCINQEDDDEKQVQIRQMDLIYQEAHVTIIAAAGTDPHFGLPGVGATSRTPQPTAWIKGRRLVSSLADPRPLINASKWMKRAWTYQENFFSTRRIVFTEQQVFYECRSGMGFESDDAFQKNEYSNFLNPAETSKYKDSSICDRLEDYCGRELSVHSDAIRAFEGVFHNLRKENHVHQYLGIPIMPSEMEGWSKKTHRSRGEAFAAGLSWCNKAQGTRRSLFPTWSWAGWTVPIKYEGSLCGLGLELGHERPLKVFIENSDGALSDMDELSDVSLDQGVSGSSSKFIHIEAWTIPIDVRYAPKGAEKHRYNKYWISKKKKTQHYNPRDDDDSGYIAISQSDEGAVQVPFYPLHQKHKNDVTTQQIDAPDFEQGRFLGIVLGRCEDFSDLSYFDFIFIMVVLEKEHCYERVGHILICPATMSWPIFERTEIPKPVIRELQSFFRSRKRRTIRLG